MAKPNISELLAALRAEDADPKAAVRAFLDGNPNASLNDVEDAALDAFNDVYGDGGREYTDEDLGRLEATTSVLTEIREVRAAHQAQVAERASKAAELAQRAAQAPEPTDPDPATETAAEGAQKAPEQGDATTAPAEPAEPAAEVIEPTQVTPAAEVVAASAKPAAAARKTTTASQRDYSALARKATPATPWTITASADIRGVSAGAELDFDGLTDATIRRLSALGKLGRNVKTSAPIASLSLARDEQLVASSGDDRSLRQLVDQVGDERRLPGGSLTAASVWCAPSETVYDLCPDLAEGEGLVNLPSITVRRGGVRYPQSPDFSEVYAELENGTWVWEEDAAGENDPKPCLAIPCPEFDECRLTPFGLCVQTDILVNHAWPELVREWIQRLLTANEHLVNSRILAALQAASTPVDFAGTPAFTGGTSSLLNIIELQATYLRYKNRMSFTAGLEAILPAWVRPWLRADLARRLGVDLISVSDARLNAFFSDRNISVQWVYDWIGHDFPVDAPPTEWPSTVPFLLYPAGTFVAARQDVIELTGVYDSVLLAENKFIGLFAEQAICVINRCHEALYVTADLCVDGATTGGTDVACLV